VKIIKPRKPEAPLLPKHEPKAATPACSHVGDASRRGDRQCDCGKWVTVGADGLIPHHMAREPLTKQAVTMTRFRICVALLYTAVYESMRTGKPVASKGQPVRHVWFPHDDAAAYELRTGNPPAEVDRPPHLRGFRLEIDMGVIPKDVVDAVRRHLRQARTAAAPPLSLGDMMRDKGMGDAFRRVAGRGEWERN